MGFTPVGDRFALLVFPTNGLLLRIALLAMQSSARIDMPLKFAGLEIDLSGLELWFWFRSVKVSRSYWQITADYKRPEPAIYDIEDGKLTFAFYMPAASRIRILAKRFLSKRRRK